MVKLKLEVTMVMLQKVQALELSVGNCALHKVLCEPVAGAAGWPVHVI